MYAGSKFLWGYWRYLKKNHFIIEGLLGLADLSSASAPPDFPISTDLSSPHLSYFVLTFRWSHLTWSEQIWLSFFELTWPRLTLLDLTWPFLVIIDSARASLSTFMLAWLSPTSLNLIFFYLAWLTNSIWHFFNLTLFHRAKVIYL
jgi:hypothetical protein